MAINEESDAKRIVDAARERKVYLRVIGGLAFKIRCPSAQHRAIARTYGDLDLVGYKKQRAEIGSVLEGLGFEPNHRFNTLQGHRRLLFVHPDKTFDIDVFLDVFPMCHELNFLGRLEQDVYTVPLPDLLLSKLQVVQLNKKDVMDIYAILQDYEVKEGSDSEVLNTGFITRLCGNDWGWYKTVTINIDKLLSMIGDYLESGKEYDTIIRRLQQLNEVIETCPKSLKWKTRAIVGERSRWYQLPEDMAGEVQAEGAHRGTGTD
jgi:hypothetical protein